MWSLNLGRWGGVRVRVHIFFFLFAAITFLFSWRASAEGSLVWMAALSLCVLLASVCFHELGHAYVAFRLGGRLRESILSPIGGLAPPDEPIEPWAAVLTHLAGPAMNLVVCILCFPAVLALDTQNFLGLLNPLAPLNLTAGSASAVALKFTFWINWVLLLVNLIPAAPFDGGRAIRAGLSSLWRVGGRRKASVALWRIALASVGGLCAAAFFCRNVESGGLAPLWFALILLAIGILFAAKQELYPDRREPDDDDDLGGYDFSSEFSEAEDDPTEDYMAQWIRQKRELQDAEAPDEEEIEREEEQRCDEILARVHLHGMDSISPADKLLLERVSARYRARSRGTHSNG